MFLLNFKEQPYQPRCVKSTAADHTGREWQEFNLYMENIQLKKVVRENILDWNVGVLVFFKPYLKLRSGISATLGIIIGRIYHDIQSEVTL